MKPCEYCGWENGTETVHCSGCGSALQPRLSPASQPFVRRRTLLLLAMGTLLTFVALSVMVVLPGYLMARQHALERPAMTEPGR